MNGDIHATNAGEQTLELENLVSQHVFGVWRRYVFCMPTEQWRKANPDKVRAARRKWYVNNREHAKAKVRERQKELEDWFQEYKSNLKCEKCGNDHPAVLTFHHINPKEKEINLAQAAHSGWSKERVMKEVAKCQCLCFNCHFILHWNE